MKALSQQQSNFSGSQRAASFNVTQQDNGAGGHLILEVDSSGQNDALVSATAKGDVENPF
jgi:hypothetical protein